MKDPERNLTCSGQETNALPSFLQAMGLPHVLSRSRYAEDNLEQAVKQGVEQYVIRGAGMDTFAFRRPDLLSQVQVFEVDHPATQAFKRKTKCSRRGVPLPKLPLRGVGCFRFLSTGRSGSTHERDAGGYTKDRRADENDLCPVNTGFCLGKFRTPSL